MDDAATLAADGLSVGSLVSEGDLAEFPLVSLILESLSLIHI